MKILFISMHSIHAVRWIENLKDTQHELYWFDVMGRGKLETIEGVKQFSNWNHRRFPYIKGECFFSKKAPVFYNWIQSFVKATANEELEKIIKEIEPDVVHSFEMQSCSYPILKTMNKFSKLRWIYSCWGSDLYFYKNFQDHKYKIRNVLKRVNYLHTDCQRDFVLAQKLDFSGEHVGVIPGGTGYKLEELESYRSPFIERKIILVKGYEHYLGRGLNIVKALHAIHKQIQNYEVVVFGAHSKVIDYIQHNKLDFKVFERHELSHQELMGLMGKALIYIGNSTSDGMPNTLLEAIVMGAFPIQSNPGGSSGEIINHGENGLLIENPENINEIKGLIIQVITNRILIQKAAKINIGIAKKRLEYEANKIKVIGMYENIMLCE
jgi:glycosyltransferase involved in cell wall biosynthesis